MCCEHESMCINYDCCTTTESLTISHKCHKQVNTRIELYIYIDPHSSKTLMHCYHAYFFFPQWIYGVLTLLSSSKNSSFSSFTICQSRSIATFFYFAATISRINIVSEAIIWHCTRQTWYNVMLPIASDYQTKYSRLFSEWHVKKTLIRFCRIIRFC